MHAKTVSQKLPHSLPTPITPRQIGRDRIVKEYGAQSKDDFLTWALRHRDCMSPPGYVECLDVLAHNGGERQDWRNATYELSFDLSWLEEITDSCSDAGISRALKAISKLDLNSEQRHLIQHFFVCPLVMEKVIEGRPRCLVRCFEAMAALKLEQVPALVPWYRMSQVFSQLSGGQKGQVLCAMAELGFSKGQIAAVISDEYLCELAAEKKTIDMALHLWGLSKLGFDAKKLAPLLSMHALSQYSANLDVTDSLRTIQTLLDLRCDHPQISCFLKGDKFWRLQAQCSLYEKSLFALLIAKSGYEVPYFSLLVGPKFQREVLRDGNPESQQNLLEALKIMGIKPVPMERHERDADERAETNSSASSSIVSFDLKPLVMTLPAIRPEPKAVARPNIGGAPRRQSWADLMEESDDDRDDLIGCAWKF